MADADIHLVPALRPSRWGGVCLLAAVSAIAGGCSTIFDAPSLEGVRSSVSEKVLGDLAEIARQELPAVATNPNEVIAEVITEEAKSAASAGVERIENGIATARSADVTQVATAPTTAAATVAGPTAAAGAVAHSGTVARVAPELTVEQLGGDATQLVLEGLTGAAITLNGRDVGLMTVDRMRVFAIEPGRHQLRVDYPSGPPFSADFLVERGERVVVRAKHQMQ